MGSRSQLVLDLGVLYFAWPRMGLPVRSYSLPFTFSPFFVSFVSLSTEDFGKAVSELPTNSNDFILGLHLGSPGRLKNKQKTRFAWRLTPRVKPGDQGSKLGVVTNIAGKARVSELKTLSS